jgi:E3 ubiquitin-protein ligase RNF144
MLVLPRTPTTLDISREGSMQLRETREIYIDDSSDVEEIEPEPTITRGHAPAQKRRRNESRDRPYVETEMEHTEAPRPCNFADFMKKMEERKDLNIEKETENNIKRQRPNPSEPIHIGHSSAEEGGERTSKTEALKMTRDNLIAREFEGKQNLLKLDGVSIAIARFQSAQKPITDGVNQDIAITLQLMEGDTGEMSQQLQEEVADIQKTIDKTMNELGTIHLILEQTKKQLREHNTQLLESVEIISLEDECLICNDVSENTATPFGCSHTICAGCMHSYIFTTKDMKLPASCPAEVSCPGTINLNELCGCLKKSDSERLYEHALESDLIKTGAFYCCNPKCGELLLNGAVSAVREECPYCKMSMCCKCKIPWHAGFTCEAYQQLPESERNEADLALLLLARENKWQRCPRCKMWIELKEGCKHMTCRCSHQFCYLCCSPWIPRSCSCRV